MRIYSVIALTLALLAGLACGNADEARQEGFNQGVRDGRQTAQAYQRTLYDLPTATPSATPAEATARPAKISLVPLSDFAAPDGYDQLALEQCATRVIGSGSFSSTTFDVGLAIARYPLLSAPEQQMMRYILKNGSNDAWVHCQDWIEGEDAS